MKLDYNDLSKVGAVLEAWDEKAETLTITIKRKDIIKLCAEVGHEAWSPKDNKDKKVLFFDLRHDKSRINTKLGIDVSPASADYNICPDKIDPAIWSIFTLAQRKAVHQTLTK